MAFADEVDQLKDEMKKGWTCMLTFGKYAGFHIGFSRDYPFRLILGWIAFAICHYDVEGNVILATKYRHAYLTMLDKWPIK